MVFQDINKAAVALYIPYGLTPYMRSNFAADTAGQANGGDELRRVKSTDARISELAVKVKRSRGKTG